MLGPVLAAVAVLCFGLTFAAWKRYCWVAAKAQDQQHDTCPYSLTEVFGDRHLASVPQQKGVQWLPDIFSRSAKRFPDHTALQIPHSAESLTFAQLDARAEALAVAVCPFLSGPDQVVAVAMAQDDWPIVAAHLGVLKAGGTVLFLDTTLPEALLTHVLEDAQPVVVLTCGQSDFRGLPTLDVRVLPETSSRRTSPWWLDDPTQRLATIFYTSGTTGMPKGVECPHAGYVNLALSYADYFELVPGMDATSLTSSLGYDGSISEMYSAWVSGCAVVLLTKEQLRSGPGLLNVLRAAEVTVLFCPPVLLTTLTPTPEFDLPYPLCRYIVPAGEAFPAALVEPWTRGRRQIINTYGPTEASTDTSRQSLRPGEPITIGSPLANVTYVILKAGELDPLPHGEAGELCIGGVHTARGYRNLPAQTAQKFITHPRFGRLYRTGDKCSIDPRTHRVHFLGRIDAQLKVRGHRVEIQPVEDILQTQFAEIEAAVLDYQNDELVAFVAARSLRDTDNAGLAPAPAAWAARIKERLAKQLPAPSVPSRIFLVDAFVMQPVSGKIDRARLPRLAHLQPAAGTQAQGADNDPEATAEGDAATNEQLSTRNALIETDCAQVLAICAEVFDTALGWDDVFADHGAHSIAIARLARRLWAAGWAVPVRDLLSDCNTARKVANRPRKPPQVATLTTNALHSGPGTVARDEAAAQVLAVGYFTTLQALFLLLLYSPHLLVFIGFVAFAEIGEFFTGAQLWQFVLAGLLLYLIALALPFASLIWVMLIKLCMGGHAYKNKTSPGSYPKWSRMHLRCWCIGRLQLSVLRPFSMMFRSAPLLAYVLLRLGASVGNNLRCSPEAEFCGPLDLLRIDDDVAIQTGAYVYMSTWAHADELHIGPVHLASGCKIGMRAGVANDVTVGRGSWITPFTPVLSDVGAGEIWEGAPARLTGRCQNLLRTAKHCHYVQPLWLMELLNILMQVVLNLCLFVTPAALIAWFAARSLPGEEIERAGDYFQITPLPEIAWQLGLCAFVTTWLTTVLISFLGSIFVRCTPALPGLYPARGLRAALLLYRMKTLDHIQGIWTWTITGQYLRALAGLRFSRLGASECDLMFNLVPELSAADSQVFWSHGCFTNMLDQGAEHLLLRRLEMPKNFLAGNNCVAECGRLPGNFIAGVSTPVNDIRFRQQMRSRPDEPLVVAGNPPVRFGSADVAAGSKAQELPSLPLFLARVALNDGFCIGMLPVAEVLAYALLYTVALRWGLHPVSGAVLALTLTELALIAACVAIKKVLVGKDWGSAHAASFWSWRHFTYFFAQDCYFAWCKRPMGIFAGTLLPNLVLRWMGCHIGKRTLVTEPLQAADWNAVSFGNDCVLAGFLQFHTFENMTLQVKRTEIRDNSTVNFGATIMGGAIIEPQTTLLPLSMVLKEMHLPMGTHEGSPAQPATTARYAALPEPGGDERVADAPLPLTDAGPAAGSAADEAHTC